MSDVLNNPSESMPGPPGESAVSNIGSLESSERTQVDEPVQASQETQTKYFIDLPSRWDHWEPLAEVIATIVLALATLITAWSGYQAGRWGGEQSIKFSQAGALRTESTRASTSAGQIAQVDIGLFVNWINAYAEDNQALAGFYEDRFRPEFTLAFDAWMATNPKNNPDAPESPFSMPAYAISAAQEADLLEEEASKTFTEGTVANQIGDNYVLNTVILASVLFLSGLQARMKSVPPRMLILILSLIILSYGIFNIVTYPIH